MSFFYSSLDLKDYRVIHEIKFHERMDRRCFVVFFDPPISSHVFDSGENIARAVVLPRYARFFSPSFVFGSVVVNLCLETGRDENGNPVLKIVDIGRVTRKCGLRIKFRGW